MNRFKAHLAQTRYGSTDVAHHILEISHSVDINSLHLVRHVNKYKGITNMNSISSDKGLIPKSPL